MFNIQKNNYGKRNKSEIFNNNLIAEIFLALLSFIYIDLIYKNINVSITFGIIFLLVLFVIDIFYLKNEYKKHNLNDEINEIINWVLIYNIKHSINDSIILAFQKKYNPIWKKDDKIKEKLELINGFFDSKKFYTFYKACLVKPRYKELSKIRDYLQLDNYQLLNFHKGNILLKIALMIIIILNIFLYSFNDFFTNLLGDNNGLYLHFVIIMLFILIYCFMIYLFKKSNNKNIVEKFLIYFLCNSIIEKPFFAFDSTCLLFDKFGEEMLKYKNNFIEGDDEVLINFLIDYNEEEKSVLIFIIECIKRNIVCYNIPKIKNNKKESFDKLIQIFIISCLMLLLFCFFWEVMYK